jgi:hypothetical protein
MLGTEKDMLPDVFQPVNKRVLAFIRGPVWMPVWFYPIYALLMIIEFAYRALGKSAKKPPISKPDHFEIGSHQGGSYKIWMDLAPSLPTDCRFVVYGKPALVHPRSGVIFAVGGPLYYLRLPPELVPEALRAGAKTRDPKYTWDDTRRDLGYEWVIGAYLPDEVRWCQAAYEHFGA